jgi:hypothetical protein
MRDLDELKEYAIAHLSDRPIALTARLDSIRTTTVNYPRPYAAASTLSDFVALMSSKNIIFVLPSIVHRF